MKRTVLLGAAAALGLAAAGITAGGAALAAGGSHTLHLTTTRLQFVNPTRHTFVETDAIFKAGKKVGYDSLSCNDSGEQVVCSLSLALENGMLLGHLTIPINNAESTRVAGKLTGGLGVFSGDKGTIKGEINGKHGSYTVKYHS